MFTTLIRVQQLHAMQAARQPLMVFDCSFDLSNPAWGLAQYLEAHVPGALHVDLDAYLTSGEPRHAASGGRHPLPVRSDCVQILRRIGFTNAMQAVVYDRNGANYCGRLWWMMKWLGHDNVAMLDGGLQAWQAAGLATESGPHPLVAQAGAGTLPASEPPFVMGTPRVRLVSTEEVAQGLGQPGRVLIDSRGAPRYRGEIEPLDPVAGHIPGALNRPFTDNLDTGGRFKPSAQLREEFARLLQGHETDQVTVYCGSGVSAIPNIVAMELAGLPRPALYAGSWSEWCTTEPALPVARG